MPATQMSMFVAEPFTTTLAVVLINAYCRRGQSVNHSCRQCLKRTLEAWGYDAEAYDALAIRETAKRRSKAHHQRWDVKGDPDVAHINRQRKYGITPAEYAAMLAVQQGVCAICEQPELSSIKGTPRSLSVDHDHATGRIRGLLCTRCNSMLGYLEVAGIAWVERADAYLMQHGTGAVSLDACTHPSHADHPHALHCIGYVHKTIHG